jgi:hypothetical protein
MEIQATESDEMDFKYFMENRKLKRIYKTDYINRRVREWETGKTDPYLERIRKAWEKERGKANNSPAIVRPSTGRTTTAL